MSVIDFIWAIAPDLPMAIFLSPRTEPWSVIRNWHGYSWFYKVPHSLWCLILIQNSRSRGIYFYHLVMDIFSHTGQWSIEPFFPVGPPVHGIWDPIEWN